ncbi:class I SAM-dependent methyltransferase [Halovenus salina]|uniref:Class I SAM-dependent methyltransferase n=1 Tax=Halovenus salina TaxID=1510225 RepID=A0ABD5W3M9_9EURY|nr:class I SAM-dependent methyltransferase [Halovenus salina]
MNERRVVREAYDEIADHYYAEYTEEVSDDPASEPVERFCERLDPADRLLSAGCGAGDTPLAAGGETAVGLDFSREQLSLARTDHDAMLVQGEMTGLPFADDTFDAVAALYSLIHIPLGDHHSTLAEFRRVLRPGGALLVTEGSSEWEGSNPDWLDSGTEMQWSIAGREATAEALHSVGFEIAGVWDIHDPTTEDGEKPFFLAELPE